MSARRNVILAVVSIAAAIVLLSAVIDNGTTAAEPSGKGGSKETGGPGHYFPKTAFEYAKMVEPELGVPPRVNLDECVEIPLYVDGVQKYGVLGRECDNPTLLGKDTTASGSVLQRYEGRTADGKALPDVVWVTFGRNDSVLDRASVLRQAGSDGPQNLPERIPTEPPAIQEDPPRREG